MRWRFILASVFLLPLLALQTLPQSKKDPLNEDEVDQVREYGDRPNERIKLFMKFIEQRTTAIKQLSTDTKGGSHSAQIRAKIEEFIRLSDELQDNLDTYDQQHADIRKALKDLVPESDKWEPILQLPPPDANYDFARKTAIETVKSICDQAKTLQKDQEKYFSEHKDEAGKNGTGPS
ncbi:MAG TPA: hypothetical protein VHB45_01455 [Alloacidobacterium sp.]|nr:hypothetical protein [Alloacidobacterium sp.]